MPRDMIVRKCRVSDVTRLNADKDPEVRRRKEQPCDNNAFHRAISQTLVMGQCLSLLPVSGATNKDASDLRFRWLSLRVLYTFVTLSVSVVMSLRAFTGLFTRRSGFQEIVRAVFYLSASLEGVLTLQVARDWPSRVSGWGKVDRAMKDRYGYPPRMRRSVVTITAVMSGYMLVKLFLPTTTMFQEPRSSYRDERDATNVDPTTPASYMGWSLRGVILYLLVKMMELTMIYQDLLVMVVSKCLSVRFKQVNDKLRRHRRQNHSPLFWRHLREDFSRLHELTERVDSVFNKIILLAYFLNVFSICISCCNTLRASALADTGLFRRRCLSLVLTVIKICCMSYFAASIHDESMVTRTLLNDVPTESYCTEVARFVNDVVSMNVAFTGMKFFSVTRAFILTLIGTILTYNVIILQLAFMTSKSIQNTTI